MQCSETNFPLDLTISVFDTRSILYSTFVVNWGLKRIQKNIMLGVSVPQNLPFRGGLRPHHPQPRHRPPAPDGFGLNPPSQLVIGYHWLAFLNQIRKNPRSQGKIHKSPRPMHYECLVQNRPYLKS